MDDFCKNGYGKRCLECHSENRSFTIVASGGGMDIEMLKDFAPRYIAIKCSLHRGRLVLELTEEQMLTLSKGKISKIEVGKEAEVCNIVKARDIQAYLDIHGEDIKVEVSEPCNILPSYP